MCTCPEEKQSPKWQAYPLTTISKPAELRRQYAKPIEPLGTPGRNERLNEQYDVMMKILQRREMAGKKAFGKPPVRYILHGFDGCVRPGEMPLILSRPGSGCSTFLKVLAN